MTNAYRSDVAKDDPNDFGCGASTIRIPNALLAFDVYKIAARYVLASNVVFAGMCTHFFDRLSYAIACVKFGDTTIRGASKWTLVNGLLTSKLTLYRMTFPGDTVTRLEITTSDNVLLCFTTTPSTTVPGTRVYAV